MVARSLDYATTYGGCAKHTLELSLALRRLGCELQVASIESLDAHNLESPCSRKTRSILRPPLDLFYLNAKLVSRNSDYDIVHSQSRDGFAFCLKKQAPLVVTMHGLTVARINILHELRYHPSIWLLAGLERLVCTRADHIIVSSYSVGSRLKGWLGIEDQRISVIHNGVNTERFSPSISGEPIRQYYELDDYVILCVTRLMPDRFVESLVPLASGVFSELPRAKMIIVGEGPERIGLRRLFDTHDCSENVIFVGARDDRQLPYFYAAADICVLPMTYQVPELVMLEAMACGKPVLFMSRGFCHPEADFVHERNIVMAKDQQDLIDRCVQLLRDNRKRTSLGAEARSTVAAKYSWQAVASKTLTVYQSVLKSN